MHIYLQNINTIHGFNCCSTYYMKLRFSKNAVRFRLSKSEVTLLNKNGELFETIQYGPDSNDQFHYGIEKSYTTDYQFIKYDNKFIVKIPEIVCDEWCRSEMIGLEKTINSHVNPFFILVEKDFKCLTERQNEDESDNFDNPNSSC